MEARQPSAGLSRRSAQKLQVTDNNAMLEPLDSTPERLI